jgi:glycosyltransferase involved in cell wall biosynthesis
MKILHLLCSVRLETGGPAEAARNMGIVWKRHGHSHDIVSLDPKGELIELPDYPGTITTLGLPEGRSLRERYRYSPDLVPWLRENAPKYDAVIVSGLWRYQTRGALVALRDLGIPYFCFCHGMLDPWFRKRYPLKHLIKQVSWWFAEGPLLAGARRVLFTCEEEGIVCDKAFWPYRVKGISGGYGTSDVTGDPEAQIAAFRAHLPALGDKRYLLFLSRIHEKKGCDLLVQAFADVAALDPDLQLVIAGPDQVGLVAILRAQAEKLGIADRLHFPGMLKGDLKYGAFRAAEAFVLPSHQENFGIVVAEALACETPVLISNKVNIWREILADGAGIVEPDDQAGTTRLLRRWLSMTAPEQQSLAAQTRPCFLKRFHIDQVAVDILGIIQKHSTKTK